MGEQTELTARLEERVIALDKKVDSNSELNSSQHHEVSGKLSQLSLLVQKSLIKCEKIGDLEEISDKHEKKIKTQHDDIMNIKRDRKWIVALLGIFWALTLAYIEYRGLTASTDVTQTEHKSSRQN